MYQSPLNAKSDKTRKLKNLNQQIYHLRKDIKMDKGQKSALNKKLKNLEIQIGDFSQQLTHIKQTLNHKKQNLAALRKKIGEP